MASSSNYKRKNFTKKFYKNCDLKTGSRPFCVGKELTTASIVKRNFWNKLPRYYQNYLQNYPDLSKSACRPAQIFLQWTLWKLGPGTSSQATFFVEFFDNKFSSVIFHKLAQYHYQTLFTWWCHDIWISGKLEFDYLKNGETFWSEIKIIFPCFTSAFY